MNYGVLFGLAFIGSIAGLVGGFVLLTNNQISKTICKYSIPFAAGVLLTISFLDLLPEAMHQMGDSALLIVLVSFLVGYVLEQWLDHFHQHDDDSVHEHKKDTSIVPLIIFGDSIHNFIDGIAIAAAYIVDPSLGVIVAISTLLHEIPHEIGDFGVMLSAGYSRSKVIAINLFSALTTFLGVGVVLFVGDITNEQLGVILSVAAGMFIYIASADLLPRVTKSSNDRFLKMIVVFLGVIVMLGVSYAIPHSHNDTEHSHETEQENSDNIEVHHDEHQDEHEHE